MPYVSKAQQGFAHTAAAKKAGFPTAEFDAASRGLNHLPAVARKLAKRKHAAPAPVQHTPPASMPAPQMSGVFPPFMPANPANRIKP